MGNEHIWLQNLGCNESKEFECLIGDAHTRKNTAFCFQTRKIFVSRLGAVEVLSLVGIVCAKSTEKDTFSERSLVDIYESSGRVLRSQFLICPKVDHYVSKRYLLQKVFYFYFEDIYLY